MAADKKNISEQEKALLVERDHEEFSYHFELENGESECWIVFTKKVPEATITPDEISLALTEAGVSKKYIDKHTIEIFCDMLTRGESTDKTVVAKGEAMEIGDDGWLELLVSPSSDEARYETDDMGKIDYRSRHAIANVKVDQDVAEIHPPGSRS